MARPKGSKDKKPRKKCPPKAPKRFCKNGHDTFICGRSKNRTCNDCKKENNKAHAKHIKEYKHKNYEANKEQILAGCKKYQEEHKEELKVKDKIRRVKNKEKIKIKSKERREKNKEKLKLKAKKYYEEHKAAVLAYRKKWAQKNADRVRKSKKQWIVNNPDKVQASKIKKQTNRNLRVVAWTDWPEVNKFIRSRPKGMAIDHYIPLQGKLVAGLHVSWNLQYLTPLENAKKFNNIDLLEASEWYGQILQQAGLK
jgi:hypothetical protein